MPASQRFSRAARLPGPSAYAAVWAAKIRTNLGWIAFAARANGLARTRLGLSVGRRVGGATVRVRAKRLIREAFRLERATLPPGLDIVVALHTPGERTLADYRIALCKAAAQLAVKVEERDRRQNPPTGGT